MAESPCPIRRDCTVARSRNREQLVRSFLFLFSVVVSTTTLVAEVSRPFLKAHCASCHRGESAEGGLDFDRLTFDLNDPLTFSRWERIHDRIELGEMPPRDEEQPSEETRQEFVKSLSSELVRAHA